jgi:hypothetical protein
MMRIGVTIQQATPGMMRALDRGSVYNGMILGLGDIGKNIKDTADKGIKDPPKTGRVYSIRGRRHRASAPGEYPATFSGRLARELGFEVVGLRMRVGSSTPYSRFLQQTDGPTKNASFTKIAPRPFLTNSHKTNAPSFQPIMRDRLLAAMRIR